MNAKERQHALWRIQNLIEDAIEARKAGDLETVLARHEECARIYDSMGNRSYEADSVRYHIAKNVLPQLETQRAMKAAANG